MGQRDQRVNHRFELAVRAVVSDRRQRNHVQCMIRDGSISGCKIVTSKVADFPEKILLRIPDLSQAIKGRLIWRKADSAGVVFEWHAKHPDERRGAPRQEVSIPAIVFDEDFETVIDCVVCDASRTGCRISSDEISELPDEVRIQIKGLTEPA